MMMKEVFKTIIFWGLSVAAILFLFGKLTTKDTWTGFYYPDVSDKSEYVVSKPFETLGQCSIWAGNKTKGNELGSTECGRNCKYNEEWQIYVCKEVVN